MAEVTRQTTETTNPAPAQPVTTENPKTEHRINMAERIVYIIGGTLISLLGLRLLLKLLGANPFNGFVDFVYDVTRPFVAPFYGMFDYNEVLSSRSRFEFETLIAILVYMMLFFLIAKLVALPSRRQR